MRLHRLTVTAFGPFAATQHVDFDRLSAAGLFLLHGPTGAGKTSILDAVAYALYGSVPGARQGSGLALRSDHADPTTPTEVVLELTVGDRRWEITRRPEQLRPKRKGTGTTRDRASALLRERRTPGGDWEPVSRSHQEIAAEVGDLLGMSRDQFCQVVLLPQGDFARFLRSSAEDRAKLLGRLFDTRRFASVEAHLAELRARAAERVRTGDERLLAGAHRVRQAAGPHPDLADHPWAGLGPGDPELADRVLEFAALARSAARERHTVAGSALASAEEAHARAQLQHAETVERARLQQRYAEATAQAAALAAQQGEREAATRELADARAADLVAPALRLRELADAEHRSAADAERRARAALATTGTPALDVPADRLAAEEHAVRERLGALTAAEAAERRAELIAAELTTIAERDTADQALLDASERRLADWPATLERLRQERERASAAGARLSELAERVAVAEARLAAAHERDRLAALLPAARESALTAREEATAAFEHWLRLKDRRLAGIAAELAAELAPGEPCAVCGSPDHPAPAPEPADRVDHTAEETAEAAHRAAEAARESAQRQQADLAAEHAAASAAAGAEPAAALGERLRAARAEHAQAGAAFAAEPAAHAALGAAEREHAELTAARQAAERDRAARAAHRAVLAAEHAALAAEIDRARAGAPSVAAHAAALARRAELLAAAGAAAGAAADTAARRKRADAALADAAYAAGFAHPEAAATARRGPAEQRAVEERLAQWRAREGAVAAALDDPRGAAAAEGPPADPDAALAALETATNRLRAASAADAGARQRCAELDTLGAMLADDTARLAPQREESRRIAGIAQLTAGTSPSNEYRMRLETYVLAARLEQVAEVASQRLHHMSAGRYALIHSDDLAAHRARSGLGLKVLDAWTGRARDTATLSGGESFFVSLALALGLADVVSAEAGGRRLDTLFIDEGFGSLDEQSLDEVLDVLDGLREHDRHVAIVSHVPDLRARVPSQLEVVKTRRGSTVRHHTVPAAN
ncbi:AAA family ATPase [Streptomyces profundus]|uniref:AAA family ATPase n=1 Tax=Streptomyces profundus TaxID=2867410 RepID=UPI001D15E6F5|nr:SMC family ATPase [Streptomyces sp. MA3_2.13]UED82834.1 SMC family ATPase [Streptomyces sp. MA3_2.13]